MPFKENKTVRRFIDSDGDEFIFLNERFYIEIFNDANDSVICISKEDIPQIVEWLEAVNESIV